MKKSYAVLPDGKLLKERQIQELLDEVDTTLTTLENKELNKYKSVHKAKARIHTFLAWQEEPGVSMGNAIAKSYLRADSEQAVLFVDWLRRLFGS